MWKRSLGWPENLWISFSEGGGFLRVSVLFNPGAGKSDKFANIACEILDRFEGHTLVTGESDFGEILLKKADVRVVRTSRVSFIEILEAYLAGFMERNTDLVVGVGGDGFLAHIASFFIENGLQTPLMGIAGGTANVGPLIGYDIDRLRGFNPENLCIESIAALVAKSGREKNCYAFNDIVVGDTFLGTIDGKMVNLSAADFIRDLSKIEVRPSERIATENFKILKNGRSVPPPPFKVAQIVVSPLFKKEFYAGKAVTGALCWAPYFSSGAAISVMDAVVIDSQLKGPDSPVCIQQILFDENDLIEIDGLSSYLIADGNVCYKINETVSVRCLKGAVKSVRPTLD
jgi:hypothetical protein